MAIILILRQTDLFQSRNYALALSLGEIQNLFLNAAVCLLIVIRNLIQLMKSNVVG